MIHFKFKLNCVTHHFLMYAVWDIGERGLVWSNKLENILETSNTAHLCRFLLAFPFPLLLT